jgi:hypothetical protein
MLAVFQKIKKMNYSFYAEMKSFNTFKIQSEG